ncbi:ferrichrome-type siderophore transporter [Metarhizium album ARSEF 1941]|uniref:Ferrichrome-type siderophore transporter n=1 Tax=Metarhizium album (strain ARSEF 1941) TaxID=1081103 RepID=A0A0B2WMY9_METAS|nr:ferrichrome-type siderophore transporter [Metarhizium album ARSEF 1941]KHN97436.1 ferrichrome-type siderophore transporter [Metarhizium album ARSEF 1941]
MSRSPSQTPAREPLPRLSRSSQRAHEQTSLLSSSESDAGCGPSRARGVVRMEMVASQLTTSERAWLFFGIFLVGYAYGLESQVRATYQPYATSSFSLHSYLSTINVLRSVVAVAVQPTAAKVADLFGRFEIVAASTACYVLGMFIESTASSVYAFCVGAIIYQIGYTCIVLVLEVLVADFSSMRARVFFSYIPALPFVVNTWISGTVTSAVLSVATWRWGIGMWCIIYPICSWPLLTTLYKIDRRASPPKHAAPKSFRDGWKWSLPGLGKSTRGLADRLDGVGLATMVGAFSFILAPASVIGTTAEHWRNPYVVASLAVGFVLVPTFVIWERRGAKTPLVPFHLLADRGVWAALAVRSLLNFAWYVQGNYLYTVLVVAFDFSIGTATRVLSFYSFFGVMSGVIAGLVVYRVRRLKAMIVGGTILFALSFVLLCRFPGGVTAHAQAGMISGQVLMGLASGLFAYPTQASIQASATRDHVAILTGLYLSFYNVGSAFGTCLAGAIWSQALYPTLKQNLAFQPNETLAGHMYKSPFAVVARYPVGTEIRSAIIESYKSVQLLLCAAGLCLCMPMIAFALALRNPRLSKQQVQEEALEADEQDT